MPDATRYTPYHPAEQRMSVIPSEQHPDELIQAAIERQRCVVIIGLIRPGKTTPQADALRLSVMTADRVVSIEELPALGAPRPINPVSLLKKGVALSWERELKPLIKSALIVFPAVVLSVLMLAFFVGVALGVLTLALGSADSLPAWLVWASRAGVGSLVLSAIASYGMHCWALAQQGGRSDAR